MSSMHASTSQDLLTHLQSPDINFPNLPPYNSTSPLILSHNIQSNIQCSNISSYNLPDSYLPSPNILSPNLPPSNLPSPNLPPSNFPSPSLPSHSLPSPSLPSASLPPPSLPSALSRSTQHSVLLPTMGSIDGFTFSDMFDEPEAELTPVWDGFSFCVIL